jgi:glycerol-3-phosphate dehydrogenase
MHPDEQRPVFSTGSREKSLQRLRKESFDVLILGGGINGAGIARDLALRSRRVGTPLRVALVEQRQFASGTSSKNSQLIHGGLRYLKQLEFGLVREALRERAALLRIAPHLVEPMPFLIPFYSRTARTYYGTGLWLYDQLAGRRRLARRRHLSRADVVRTEPGLSPEGLTSGAIFFDCRVQSARFVLENIFAAAAGGAVITNYTRAESYSIEGSGFRVALTDTLSGEALETTAEKLVDTTGPWERSSQLRLVRGSHIVLPRLNASNNAIAYFAEDGRIVFLIPWGPERRLSLVGTTDRDHSTGPEDVRVTPDEIRYLLGIVERLFPGASGVQPIAAYSSLRPLLQDDSESATKTSREHRIWNSSDGVLHVAGGKYTTYRVMSEEAADAVAEEIAPELRGKSLTLETPLGGNSREQFDELLSSSSALASDHGLETDEVERLIHDYGQLAPVVLDYLPESPREPLSRLESAVIAFAVHHEMAQRLPDLLFVSTYWGYERSWSAHGLQPFAWEMGRLLGWGDQRIEQEVELSLRITAIPAY